jgi:release factor glutamine methyltransferase
MQPNPKMSDTIRHAISEAAQVLQLRGVAEPRAEAGLLLMHVLSCDRAFLIAHSSETLADNKREQFRSLIDCRAAGWPLQYLTGRQEFYRLDFEVTPDVLIPRPETELIVEAALILVGNKAAPRFADIGTGSGCLAVSLLYELPRAHAVAVDSSRAALMVAQRNAERHQVSDRLRLVHSDLFSAFEEAQVFDAIVSNPPYVPANDLPALQREVQREPEGALDGGPDGLAIVRRLLSDAPNYLRPGGYLIFEIGAGQAEAVTKLIDSCVWELLGLKTDLQAIPRTVVLQKGRSFE